MIKVLFDLNFDMIVYFITFFGLIQEKDNYSTRSGMTTAATIYNNNPVPVVHNAAVRIRTKVGSTSKYSANPPHTPNKKRSFLDLYNVHFLFLHLSVTLFYNIVLSKSIVRFPLPQSILIHLNALIFRFFRSSSKSISPILTSPFPQSIL